METKFLKVGRYTVRTHLYKEHFWKIGFLVDAKYDKYNGQRCHSQLIALGFHFSADLYISDRDRLRVV